MEQNLCCHCFQIKQDPESLCPYCGYNPTQNAGKYPLALPFKTVLCGRYILGHALGQGGFGITYVAMDYQTRSRVAVKEYFPDTMATRTNQTVTAFAGQRSESFYYGKQCFLEEAETLAQFIGNPNIIRVYSYFEENNTAYFVMEYVEGQSLQDYVRERGGRISWAEAKRILLPAMYALAAVHAKGVIHRDVTPDNIFMTKDNVVKLLDFGAARYSLGDKSRSLDVVLKHGFAPKEQYTRHGRQGPYTDVYSFAATLYAVTTGRIPPDSIDRMDEDDLVPPSRLGVAIPAEEEDVLLKALAVQPAERYQRMEELIQAIQQTNGIAQQTVPPAGMQNYIEFGAPPVSQPAPPVLQPVPLTPQPVPPETAKQNKAGKIVIPAIALSAVLVIAAGVFIIGKIAKGRSGQIVMTEGTTTVPDRQTVPETAVSADTEEPQTENILVLDTENAGTAVPEKVTVSLEVGSVEMDPATGEILERISTEYNDAGQKTRELHYAGDNSIQSWVEYQYDANGNIANETSYTADNSVERKMVYYNDEKDPAVTYMMLYDGKDQLIEGYAIKTNAMGQLVRRCNLDAERNVISTLEHVYDSRGNEVQATWYDSANQVTSYVVYRYSYMSGYTTMDEISYDGSGKGIKTDDHVYDKDNHELEWIWYYDDGTIHAWQKYEYDDAGRMTKCSRLAADGSCDVWTEYHYDQYGNKTEGLSHYADGHTEYDEYCVYEYDTNGKMLKQTVSVGSPDQVQWVKEYKVYTVSAAQIQTSDKAKR